MLYEEVGEKLGKMHFYTNGTKCYLGALSRRERVCSGESKNLGNHGQDLWGIGRKFCGKVLSSYPVLLMALRILDKVPVKQTKTFKIVRAQRLGLFILAMKGHTSKAGVSVAYVWSTFKFPQTVME